MKTLIKVVLFAVATTASLPSFDLVQTVVAADENIGEAVGTINVPPGLSKDTVKNVIRTCFMARSWQITSNTDGKMVGHYARKANEATLTIKYDAVTIEMFCVGRARGGGLPVRWIERLRLDITAALAAEAAALDTPAASN
jgi:hypothetical protein